jgi:hypothetical protein
MVAQEVNAEWMSLEVSPFDEIFEQGGGMISHDDDNTHYLVLAEVMQDALTILAELRKVLSAE